MDPALPVKLANNVSGTKADFGHFLDVRDPCAGVGPLPMRSVKRWLALRRYSLWWLSPVFGESPAGIPARSQVLLWETDDGDHAAVLPMVDGDVQAHLRGTEDGLHVDVDGHVPGDEPAMARIAWCGRGDDPYALVRDGVADIASATGNLRLREDKSTPRFVDLVGWCTWNAFYKEVDAQKVERGLRAFQEAGLVPPLVILDDGWQRGTDTWRLHDFGAIESKFPGGLASLIERARNRYGVACFGVWHALHGYWEGVDPDGPLAARYRLHHHPVPDEERDPNRPAERCSVHPDDIARFFSDYHDALRREGVDMVKVDSQSSMPSFIEGELGRGSTMGAYQYALQASTRLHFDGNLLNCMSMGSEVAYHLLGSTVLRNSDDFYPDRPHTQGRHIQCNALSNLWTSVFSVPDWDMFQTHHEGAWYHAAARAISGGPVYVADEPGKSDVTVIRSLCDHAGRVLRCARPALPSRDRLFVDTYNGRRLLKVTNRNGELGMLGIFNTYWHDDSDQRDAPITDRWQARDCPGIRGRVACFAHSDGRLIVTTAGKSHELTLGRLGWELITISPVREGLAPLGLIDKLNAGAAVAAIRHQGNQLIVELVDGGRFGLYAEHEPRSVVANGWDRRFRYSDGLVQLNLPAGRAWRIVVTPA